MVPLHPRQVIDELHQQDHVHFMLSVWPGFGPETAVYQSLDSIGALFSEHGPVDAVHQ